MLYYINTQLLTALQIKHLELITNFYKSRNYNIIDLKRGKDIVLNIYDNLDSIKEYYPHAIEITYTELLQLLNKTEIYECWI